MRLTNQTKFYFVDYNTASINKPLKYCTENHPSRHFGLKVGVTEHKRHTLKQIFQEWQKFAGFDFKHPISMPTYTYLVFYASEPPRWREELRRSPAACFRYVPEMYDWECHEKLLTGTRQFKENREKGTRYNAPRSVGSFMRYYWTY